VSPRETLLAPETARVREFLHSGCTALHSTASAPATSAAVGKVWEALTTYLAPPPTVISCVVTEATRERPEIGEATCCYPVYGSFHAHLSFPIKIS
jgi:hypothetical protein